jgi:hypothetical protein
MFAPGLLIFEISKFQIADVHYQFLFIIFFVIIRIFVNLRLHLVEEKRIINNVDIWRYRFTSSSSIDVTALLT